MTITQKDVRHLAKLANLELGDDEVERMSVELGAIVAYVEQLRAIDTTGVEAIAQVTGLVNVTREDVPGTVLTSKEILANAPLTNEVAILVPKAVER